MGMVFSDLNLNGDAPVRVRPEVGEWGPPDVISTASKKRQRILVVILFILAVAAVCGLGYFWFQALMNAATAS